jgi:hypothetical protein
VLESSRTAQSEASRSTMRRLKILLLPDASIVLPLDATTVRSLQLQHRSINHPPSYSEPPRSSRSDDGRAPMG